MNYKEVCGYIAANKTEIWCQQSDLRRILPTRKNTGGVHPSPTVDDAMGPHSNDENLWRFPEGIEFSDHEKRKVVAEVVPIGVRTMFATHVYRFGGRLFPQKIGGPIGLRSKGAIARVVMAMTDRRVKLKMDKDGIKTKLDARYVDDGRTLLHPIKAGWKWSEGESRMVWSEEQEADDTLNSTWPAGRREQSKIL